MPPKPLLSHLTTPQDLVAYFWHSLSLPTSTLSALHLTTPTFAPPPPFLPSSFKVDLLATSTIAFFHLLVSHYKKLSTPIPLALPRVTVDTLAACLEFKSECMYTLNGNAPQHPSSIGGLHRTNDGYVRIHDGFRVHRENMRRILGLEPEAGRAEVAAACLKWGSRELEEAAAADGAVVAALRSMSEWEASSMGEAEPYFPIAIRSLDSGEGTKGAKGSVGKGCLTGLRVLEFTRVIAGPVAGRALAAHGADVLWITSPKLEDQPSLDVEFSRGKRSVRLDLDDRGDLDTVRTLVRDADVFIQGYRPASLAERGLGPDQLCKINPRLVYASLSAYPQVEEQPWKARRGFDSIVQTCSGINVAEAVAWNAGVDDEMKVPARALPCQALDHASGMLLAAGIVAALCRRLETGEGQLVEVSLAGTGKLLRSLGQNGGGFGGGLQVNGCQDVLDRYEPEAEVFFEERDGELGRVKFLQPAGRVDGAEVGWERMAQPLASDKPVWL